MTGILILAAGSSSRLGTAKQNLVFKGKTLLQQAVQTALKSNFLVVSVVLGANADTILPTIKARPVPIFINERWEEGMGSSISYGLDQLLKLQPTLSSVILMLSDQPFVDTALINQLIQHASPNKIIASAYSHTIGPPTLFDKAFFTDLLALSGHEGAKKVLLKYKDDVIEVDFPLGSVDIDTMGDYERLNHDL